MQVFVNEAFLAKRAKIARWGSIIGLAVLVLGLFVVGTNVTLSYVFLIVGFICATVASFIMYQYVREPRADQVIAKALRQVDRRYSLYSYYLPSDNVILSHHGITVVIPRMQKGRVWYDGKRWHHKAGFSKVKQFFGEPGVGRPELDVAQDIRTMQKWLAKRGMEDVPVNGLVVFVNPEIELELDNPPVPVVQPDNVADFFKEKLDNAPKISTARLKELRRIIANED